MSNDILLLNFAKTLTGKYSNKEQAQEKPRHFAHINIYYRPLDWNIFNGPWFYSEQSFDYLPWSPYKQSLHRLIHYQDTFIVENYALKSPERFAGSGFRTSLLKDINKEGSYKRSGCSMYFKEIKKSHYLGHVEPGNNCLIDRAGTSTYLISKVEFNAKSWTSLDKGMEISTHKKVWGSDHGALKFKKIDNIGMNLIGNWK